MLGGTAAGVWTGHGAHLAYAPAIGWIIAAVVYLAWTWGVVGHLDAAATRDHAQHHENDVSRRPAHLLVMVASLASLAGVGYLLHATSAEARDPAAAAVGVLSVFASWCAVHTVYALRYARMYYTRTDGEAPGIDFNGDNPAYLDFAYLAFSIGMCYGVTDTTVTSRRLRGTVLSQALLSYLLGAVIIGVTINLVSGLAG